MLHPYQILLPLLSLFWVRVDLTDLFPLTVPVQILDIRDGDTFTVRSENSTMKVRLSRIDAPELHQPFHGTTRDAGFFSRDCVRKLSSKEGVLRIEGFDLYHRILGDVSGVNFKAVKEGCAGIYPHARFSSVREKIKFVRALQDAKNSHRGVWAYGGYILPKKWRKISKRSGHQQWHRPLHSRVIYPLARKFSRRAD